MSGLSFSSAASTSVSVVSPDRTRTDSIPFLLPSAISVYILSPNTAMFSFSVPDISQIISAVSRLGFPKNKGETPVDAVTAAAMAPLSGINPVSPSLPLDAMK